MEVWFLIRMTTKCILWMVNFIRRPFYGDFNSLFVKWWQKKIRLRDKSNQQNFTWSNMLGIGQVKEDYVTHGGLDVTCYIGDVTQATADGVVIGESSSMTYASSTTTSFCNMAQIEYTELRRLVKMRSSGGVNYGQVYCMDINTIQLPFRMLFVAIVHQYNKHAGHRYKKWKQQMLQLYRKILEKAESNGLKSLAIPVLGSGGAGAPVDIAVEVLVTAVSSYALERHLKHVSLVCFTRDVYEKVLNEWDDYFSLEEAYVGTPEETRIGDGRFANRPSQSDVQVGGAKHDKRRDYWYHDAISVDSKENTRRALTEFISRRDPPFTQKREPKTDTYNASANTDTRPNDTYEKRHFDSASHLKETETFRKGRSPTQQKLKPHQHIGNLSKKEELFQDNIPRRIQHAGTSRPLRPPAGAASWEHADSAGITIASHISADTSYDRDRDQFRASGIVPEGVLQLSQQADGENYVIIRHQYSSLYIPTPKRDAIASGQADDSSYSLIPHGSYLSSDVADQHSKQGNGREHFALEGVDHESDSGNEERSSSDSKPEHQSKSTFHGSSSQLVDDPTEHQSKSTSHGLRMVYPSEEMMSQRQFEASVSVNEQAKLDMKAAEESHSSLDDAKGDQNGDVTTGKTKEQASASASTPEEPDSCAICMDEITDPKRLSKCGHTFCAECIDNCFTNFKPVCPTCNTVYGILTGNQPPGEMKVKLDSSVTVPGYDRPGVIVIDYFFKDGIQTEKHPNPRKPYHGARRRAFLPGTGEGRTVLGLLQVAFDRRLTFTIGRSTTTGREDTVTWNDIHHKTNLDGGPTRFGYPDATYLSRVKEELASKGVTEKDL